MVLGDWPPWKNPRRFSYFENPQRLHNSSSFGNWAVSLHCGVSACLVNANEVVKHQT